MCRRSIADLLRDSKRCIADASRFLKCVAALAAHYSQSTVDLPPHLGRPLSFMGSSLHEGDGHRGPRPPGAKRLIDTAAVAPDRRGMLERGAAQDLPETQVNFDIASRGGAPERATEDALTVPEDGECHRGDDQDEPGGEPTGVHRRIDVLHFHEGSGLPLAQPVHRSPLRSTPAVLPVSMSRAGMLSQAPCHE